MDAVIEQINSMGRAFVDFAFPMLWQSSVLIAILLALDFILRGKVRAVFRYWLWMLVFIKLVLPTTLSSPIGVGQLIGEPMAAINITENKQPVDGDISNVPSRSSNSANVVEASVASPAIVPVHSPSTAPTVSLIWQGGVFIVWLAIVAAMVLLLLQRAVFVCGLVRQATEANGLMKNMLGFCCQTMGVRGRVGLKVSPNATSPAVCGLFRPVVLLPHGIGSNLGSGQLRVVLMHELAHIKRGDLWINLLQTLLQIAYFYNPLLWLANWIIRRVREQAVDEKVQVALGEKARQYPETLLNVARLAFERPALSLRLIGVVESKGALAGRIKRMLNQPIPKTAKLGIIGSLSIILFAAVLLPMAKGMSSKPKEPTAIGQIIKDKSGKVTYRVNDKITLEILGITKWPVTKDSVWWSADGTVLDKSLSEDSDVKRITKISFGYKERENFNYYVVASRSDKPKEATVRFHAKSVSGREVGVPAMGGKDKFIYILNASEEAIKAGRVILTTLVSDDEWRTVKKFDVKGDAGSIGGEGFTYTTTNAGWSTTNVTLNSTEDFASYHETMPMDSRVIAIDKKGRIYTRNGGAGGVSTEGLHTQLLVFDLSKNSIDHLELQHRPFRVYEFRNVSFQPGVKTDVQVAVTRAEAQAKTPQGAFVVKKKVVGIGPGWQRLQRVIGDNYRGSIGGYSDDEQKCAEYFEKVLSWAKPGDTFVMTFAFDEEKYGHSQAVPKAYQDLLPKPWKEIKEDVNRGEMLELKGKARGFDTIVLAAPTLDQLEELIKSTELLQPFKTLIEQNETNAEKAVGEFDIVPMAFDINFNEERDVYSLQATIRNGGRVTIPKFKLNFYRGNPADNMNETGRLHHGWHEAGPIEPGKSWCEGTSDFHLPDGDYEFNVVLNYDNSVAEADKSNNRMSMIVVIEDGRIVEKKVSLSSAKDEINYSNVTVQEGVGFDGFIVGDPNCTGEFIKSKLGEPDEEKKGVQQGWWIAYSKKYGMDFWLNLEKRQDMLKSTLCEIRLNKGFKGKLASEISMSSTKQDVFKIYGEPIIQETVENLKGDFTDRVLFKRKDGVSLIYYKDKGVLFWFEGDKIYQMVVYQQDSAKDKTNSTKVYGVNRNVNEFDQKEDLSTPESAYAAINRVSANGDAADWIRVSIKQLAESFAGEKGKGKMNVEPEWAKVQLNAKILEVRICDGSTAVVIAQLQQEFSSKLIQQPVDVRHLKLEDGKWLNTGNDRVWTIEEARAMFYNLCEKSQARAKQEDKVSNAGSGIN